MRGRTARTYQCNDPLDLHGMELGASKFNDWNERMGRPDVSNEQISYLLYLVAADIADSNLESDTPRWFWERRYERTRQV